VIADFFARAGEEAFRDAEEQIINEITSRSHSFIFATGGGVVLREQNREYLRTRMQVHYLQCTSEEIAMRLHRRTATRPLLHGQDPRKRLQDLLREREALYLQTAHHVIPLHGLTLSCAVQRVRKTASIANSPSIHSPQYQSNR